MNADRRRVVVMLLIGQGLAAALAAPLFGILALLLLLFDLPDPIPEPRVVGTVPEQAASHAPHGPPLVYGHVYAGRYVVGANVEPQTDPNVIDEVRGSPSVVVQTASGRARFALPVDRDRYRHGCRVRTPDLTSIDPRDAARVPPAPNRRYVVTTHGLRVGDPVILLLDADGAVRSVSCATPDEVTRLGAIAATAQGGALVLSVVAVPLLLMFGAAMVLAGLVMRRAGR